MTIFSNQVIRRAERVSMRLGSKFKRNEDGATAVEFAFVALPFFMLLFGILELAIVFFVNSALVHATSEAGRTLRTGNFQACGGVDEFKALVCGNMTGMASCWKNVRIDVVSGNSFKTIALPTIPDPLDLDPTQTGADAVPQTVNGNYSTNSSGDMMVVRSTFYYRLVLPTILTRLDNPKGSGVRTMVATTAFRNEPFPTSGTCDADTQTQITDGTPT